MKKYGGQEDPSLEGQPERESKKSLENYQIQKKVRSSNWRESDKIEKFWKDDARYVLTQDFERAIQQGDKDQIEFMAKAVKNFIRDTFTQFEEAAVDADGMESSEDERESSIIFNALRDLDDLINKASIEPGKLLEEFKKLPAIHGNHYLHLGDIPVTLEDS